MDDIRDGYGSRQVDTGRFEEQRFRKGMKRGRCFADNRPLRFVEQAAEGDYIELWKDVTTVTGTPVLDSESVVINAERGLYWDTTDIAKGLLRVAYDPTVSIRGIAASDIATPVYTLDGRRVTQPRSGHVYIINGHKIIVK